MNTIFPVERDAGLLPIHSHTLPVSARPLFSTSPLIELDQASLSTREDCDDYVREDLGDHVFIDFEVFMKTVLHVPVDWKTLWRPAIEAIKEDCEFKEHCEQYLQQCISPAPPEKSFYKPLMNLMNVIVDAFLRCDLDGISSGSQYHHHQNCQLSGTKHLHWANPLHVLEAGQHRNNLCDGENIPRLVVDGVDPISNHAFCRSPSQDDENKSSTTNSESTSSKPKKLTVEGSHNSSESARRARTDCRSESSTSQACSDGARDEDGGEDGSSSESESESNGRINPALHVCRYLLEKFSGSLLRSHATSGLVDRDRLQLYHANRSVILVSSAINFSNGDGLNKFIAFFIASYCLSLEQNGIPDTLVDDNEKPAENSENLQDHCELVQAETSSFSNREARG